MLVTTRKVFDKIYISSELLGEITLHIMEAEAGEVTFAINAPRAVLVKHSNLSDQDTQAQEVAS